MFLFQVYGSAALTATGVEILQRHPIEAVSNVTRELFVRGFVRRPDHCGSDTCVAKTCPHKKVCDILFVSSTAICIHPSNNTFLVIMQRNFILSDAFFDAQNGILLAPFYADLIERQSGQSGSAPAGSLSTHSFLAALQAEPYESLPLRTLLVAQCLAARPNDISSKLDVQPADSLRVQSSSLCCRRAGSASSRSLGGEVEDVLLLGQEVFEEHSGFCDKTLNSLKADFILSAGAAGTAAAPLPTRSAEELHVSPDAPWLQLDGKSVNHALLNALSAKVLAVLAEKPGANLSTLHTSLLVLSRAHSLELLRLMEGRGQVRTVAASRESPHKGTARAEDLFGFSSIVFSALPAATATAGEMSYFANNLICHTVGL